MPSAPGLIGRIEHAAQFGQLVTDFTLIKPGALHKANGGYLIIDVRKLLLQPYAYEELKRALLARQIRIESLAQRLGYAQISTLEPEAIPLDVKVVLVGDPMLYYLLSANDPEFPELFKVQAELSDRMAFTPEIVNSYARLVAKLVRREKLKTFTAAALARILEHSQRMVEDRERLSARFAYILDWLREADYWAGEDNAAQVDGVHVEKAISARIRRADRVREIMHEQIGRGQVLIDTSGAKVGQVNGLSVLQMGGFTFGKPSRISARVRLGRGEILDIERQVELGGPLHSKGVLILTGYLGAKSPPRRRWPCRPRWFSSNPMAAWTATARRAPRRLRACVSALARRAPKARTSPSPARMDQHGERAGPSAASTTRSRASSTCARRAASRAARAC